MPHWVNGQSCAQIAVTDRGLLYGQSVFETIAVFNKQPLLLNQHLDRLVHGCSILSIELDRHRVLNEIQVACSKAQRAPQVLRVTITMGSGGRGYLNPLMFTTNRIISLFDYPDIPASNYQSGVVLGVADIRLSSQPVLAGLKHSNRLEQVIARSQWQAGWDEALVLDQSEYVIEATHSNIFIVKNQVIKTPDLTQCGVAGVMRERILQLADSIEVATQIVPLSLADIESADEVFLSNSLIGIWPVKELKESTYQNFKTSHKLLNILRKDGSIPTY